MARRLAPWRARARAAILAALADGRAAGLTGRDLERHVSKAYPFGARECWPYRVWRNEFALLVLGRVRPMRSRFKGAGKRPAEEQLGLFDGLGHAVGR